MSGKLLEIESHPDFKNQTKVYGRYGPKIVKESGTENYLGVIYIRTKKEYDEKAAKSAMMRFLLRRQELPQSLIPDVSLSKPNFPDWYPISMDYHYLRIDTKFTDPKDSKDMEALLDKMAKSVKRSINKKRKTDPNLIFRI